MTRERQYTVHTGFTAADDAAECARSRIDCVPLTVFAINIELCQSHYHHRGNAKPPFGNASAPTNSSPPPSIWPVTCEELRIHRMSFHRHQQTRVAECTAAAAAVLVMAMKRRHGQTQRSDAAPARNRVDFNRSAAISGARGRSP